MSVTKSISCGVLLLAGVYATACSSSSDSESEEAAATAATCAAHTSSATSTAAAKPVSFQRDVLPIFNRSCAFGSCHGSRTGRNNGIYLGAPGDPDASAIREALVGKGPAFLPSMKYVTPSQPEQSYLLMKLDGDFCGIPACDEGKCGQRMPRGGAPLEASARETVAAWIAQGAQDR